ncbi:MAG: hypothetical protein OXC95_15585, partial [Dehalococcoidia bacterium]|nr:hypothetical protein [Dehalococcoidia bacterium]
MDAVKAIFLTAVTLACAVGCGLWGDSGPPPELPETWLSEMLQTVPAQTDISHRLRYLWIASYEAGRVPLPMGYDSEKDAPYVIPWGTIGAPPGDYWNSWPLLIDTTGLNILYRDQAVWIHGEFFGIHTGELGEPAEIRARLSDTGYERYYHRGVEYYRFVPDYYSARDKHPYGSILYMLVNNIAFVDERKMITSRHTEDLKKVIDAREGLVQSMGDEERWRTLAKASGDEILGGLLIAPEYVMRPFETENWGRGIRTRSDILEDWARYAEGPDAWGMLEPYTASAIGYTLRDGAAGTLIALYHPDPEAADRNAVELKHRWKSAHMALRNEETFTTTQESSQGPDIPFTEMCAPLETRTLVFDESSVLLANCTAIEREAIFGGAGGYDFYWGVFNYHELHFLVPDISGL